MSRARTKDWWQGFVLIELLVVLAIISVLLTVMLPSLGRARQIARVVICQSHLKSIPAACHMYLDDHDGYFLQGVNRSFTYGGWEGKHFAGCPRPFKPFLNLPAEGTSADDAKIFMCPGDIGRQVPSRKVYSNGLGTSYQTDILLIGRDQINTTSFPGLLGDELNRRLKRFNVSVSAMSVTIVYASEQFFSCAQDKRPVLLYIDRCEGCLTLTVPEVQSKLNVNDIDKSTA